MIALHPNIRARLRAGIEALEHEGRTAALVERMLAAFQERFPLDRLARLSGVELLIELHGRGGDSFAHWLEHKNDKTFNARQFGSIKGGSALKFVVFQAAEDDLWYTGNSHDVRPISAAEAAAVAERQRDQLLAALAVVRALPDDVGTAPWDALQAQVAAAAPDYHQLAFFHKAVALYAAQRLDDYHSIPYQTHALVSCGLDSSSSGLWANARRFVALQGEMAAPGRPLPMSTLTGAMNRLFGPPVHTWRVGAWTENYDAWPEMRDAGLTAVGWTQIGDLRDVVGQRTGHDAIKAIKDALRRQWPDTQRPQEGKNARQLWKFFHHMAAGDRVVAAQGQRILGVGEVVGDYYFDGNAAFGHRRQMRWLQLDAYQTAHKDGLQTTVSNLDGAIGLRAEIAGRLAGDAVIDVVEETPASAAVQTILDQLERKGQVILHGPPGTGKTFHALQAAEEMVARSVHGKAWSALTLAERETLKVPGPGQRLWTSTFHPAFGYEDFVEGLHPLPVPGGLSFEPRPGLFRRICEVARQNDQRFVLVIDEFNRGDAPRIFGELLTLLELDKRERVHVVLPHSGAPFTVPRNVRLIATMNTSDRSIALLDAALRRRFGFVELLPDPTVLGDASVGGISLAGLMTALNRKLLQTLGDRARDLQVGHSYLMRDHHPLASLAALRDALRYDVLPLLQEYCTDDPRSLHALVGDELYDPDARRFRLAALQPGAEDALADALLSWGSEVKAASGADAVGEEQPDEDDA